MQNYEYSTVKHSSTEVLRSLEDYSDVASWINDILSTDDTEGQDAEEGVYDLSELERRVSHLSAVLEVACEDTSAQLEKTIEIISRTVPRLTYDLQLMQESALSLQVALHAVESHSQSLLSTSDMAPVLNQLYFLDTVKRNMDASLNVLREAEAWSSLESEVISYLAEQSYSKAASRLSEATKSLGVFENTPEFENRKTLMTNLQNQLEAALSSALVAGINSNDVDACKKYFDIFCHIEREAEFRSYWNGSKRKGIVILWEQTELRDCEQHSIGKEIVRKLAAFLPVFFQEILSVLQTERLSVVLIFPDPQSTLSTFITSTLSSLHPSPSQRLNLLVNFYGDLVLPELISTFKATEEFAVATDKIMEKVGYSITPSALPPSSDDRDNPSSQRPLSRRRSTRQSFSRRLNRSSVSGPITGLEAATSSTSLDHSWEEALFEPFLDYQCDYATLEKRLLRAQLKTLLAPTVFPGSPATAGARLLRESVVDLLTFADDALARCMAFTHGYGVVGLVQALDDLFEEFLASVRRNILEVGSTAVITDVVAFESGDEFAELDYSSADLAAFQLALHLLEAARGVLERLAVFEAKLRASVVQTAGVLRMARDDPFGMYVSGTTRTALGLLQGSALKSVELQSLLDAVDPEQPHQPNSAFTPGSATFAGQKTSAGQLRTSLLLGSRKSVSEFAKACQLRLQDTILSPLLKQLSTYAASSVWASEAPRERRTGGASGAISEVVMPTFSLSPSATIQRVAEGLLSLPRLLEVYADDDALAFSIDTLPFIDEESLKSLAAERASAEPEPPDIDVPRSRARHLPSPSLSVKVPSVPAASPPTLLLTPEAVSSAWLASLALVLLAHLTGRVLPAIARLSTRGAAQLAEDLAYVGQIGRALNVEWPALEIWREAVGLDEDEVRQRLRLGTSKDEEKEKEEKIGMVEVLRVVGKLRGWMV
ncbi:hypothetical protein EW145_g4963 [Phellinidium pouzarii]|uniref:Conserved oligomeric Golgi complex subunit 7 n=1 Tax=Phellinidium pouzarii TaxID=167371 RepID=A0A4S4L292_9AGAM|nr:hypothetical protein EW145_g4963 [Phellinidium pouzarii]